MSPKRYSKAFKEKTNALNSAPTRPDQPQQASRKGLAHERVSSLAGSKKKPLNDAVSASTVDKQKGVKQAQRAAESEEVQQAVAPTSDDPMRFGPGSYGEFPADQSGQVMPSQREHKASTADKGEDTFALSSDSDHYLMGEQDSSARSTTYSVERTFDLLPTPLRKYVGPPHRAATSEPQPSSSPALSSRSGPPESSPCARR